jgi:sulfate adenylyltransferase (ADP) / ATP adenylyltransferase
MLKSLFKTFEKACNDGAVLFTPSEAEIVMDAHIPCVIRLASTLLNKQIEAKQIVDTQAKTHHQSSTDKICPKFSPFMPCDPRVFVTELSTQRHILLLNRFSIVKAHALIVTKNFESQLDDINEYDMEAAVECLLDMDALIFYNCGESSGASQSHKHLQVIPLPLIKKEELKPHNEHEHGNFPDSGLPIDALLDRNRALDREGASILQSFDELEFLHVFVFFAKDIQEQNLSKKLTMQLMEIYQNMLVHMKKRLKSQALSHLAYNLLFTRRWMMMVPRKHEEYDGISINSVGFTGNLLAKSHEQLLKMKDVGPLTILRHVTYSNLESPN